MRTPEKGPERGGRRPRPERGNDRARGSIVRVGREPDVNDGGDAHAQGRSRWSHASEYRSSRQPAKHPGAIAHVPPQAPAGAAGAGGPVAAEPGRSGRRGPTGHILTERGAGAGRPPRGPGRFPTVNGVALAWRRSSMVTA